MSAFNPFSDSALGIVGLALTYLVAPFSKEIRHRLRTRRAMRAWLYGIKGEAGISVDQLSAPEQFFAMQSDITTLKTDVKKVLGSVGDLVDVTRALSAKMTSPTSPLRNRRDSDR